MNLFRGLYELLYGSTPAEFKSSLGLQESIDRLRAATRRSVFSALSQQAAVGPVKESSVRLQRVIPMVGNSFKPFFFGRFETRGRDVYLSGKFTMLPLVKVFMTIWLGMAIFIGIGVLANNRTQSSGWPAMLAAFGMTGLGIAFVWAGKWFARNDVAWLSNVIRGALETPIADRPLEFGVQPSSTTAVSSSPPTVLRVVAGFLVLMGIIGLLMAIFGTESVHWTARGFITKYFPAWPPRLVAGIHAVVLLGLAVGIHQRKLLAWRLGLVYLGAAWCLATFQMFTGDSPQALTAVKVIFPALSLLVAGLWIRWWYAQRVHFQSNNHGWPVQRA